MSTTRLFPSALTLVAGLTCFGGSVGAILGTAPDEPTEASVLSSHWSAPANAAGEIDMPTQTVMVAPADDALFDAVSAADAELAHNPAAVHRSLDVGLGDTLSGVLGRGGVAANDSAAAISALRAVFDPRSLRAGQSLALTLIPNPQDGSETLITLALATDARHQVRVSRDLGGGYNAYLRDLATGRSAVVADGEITSSLYADAARARIPDAIVSEMIRAFSWDVDFQRDLHPGDRFSVMFEQLRDRDSAVLGTGDLIYARLVLGGQPRALYRHVTADGTAGYYTPDGRSARKELLRTPVDGARLSSQFGMRRHPILGYSRMHRGIDFAAPTGTPVFAAGDGRITFIGRNKGYGNYIRIDHTGATATATAYGHLSRFAPGLRQNSVVKQGQVIAQVGSTGMSTGPHLHYEFMVDGQQIDPLQARSVTQISLNGDEMTRFAATMAMADRQFAALGHDNAITVTAAAAAR